MPQAAQRGSRGADAEPAGWDLVVVDMQPTPEALALLALPEQLRRYLRRLLPPERQAARALRPMLAQLAGVPLPARLLYETAARWETELAASQAAVTSPALTVRLVAEPGPAAAEALRTARAGFALFGRRLDAVVANRVLPTGSADGWLAALSGSQQRHLKELHGEHARDGAVAVTELPHLGRDPHGIDDLDALRTRATTIVPGLQGSTAESTGMAVDPPDTAVDSPGTATGSAAAADRAARGLWTVENRLASDGVLVWRLPLPGAERADLELIRHDDEIVLTVGPFRRIVTLPSALRRCTVSGAGLTDGALHIRFTPDPARWPSPPGTSAPRTPPAPPVPPTGPAAPPPGS
jgi:arsenite-transporting ATPase